MVFNDAKYIVEYLDERYKIGTKATMAEDEKFILNLIADHSKKDLEKMLRRIKSSISVSKDTSYVMNHPFSFLGIIISVFSTLVLAGLTLTSNTMLAYVNNYIKIHEEEVIEKDQLKDIILSLDFSPLFTNILWTIIVIISSVIGSWIYLARRVKKRISKLYYYQDIIEEAIEDYENVKGNQLAN